MSVPVTEPRKASNGVQGGQNCHSKDDHWNGLELCEKLSLQAIITGKESMLINGNKHKSSTMLYATKN
jgi:hypothetical protein